MSFEKFRNDSYCVGRRHRSFTSKIYGYIASKVSEVLISFCLICKRKKSMIVSNVLKNQGKALEITSNIATAAATENPKAVYSSLPELINFCHRGKGLHLGKFV